jgi:hypothetical protein
MSSRVVLRRVFFIRKEDKWRNCTPPTQPRLCCGKTRIFKADIFFFTILTQITMGQAQSIQFLALGDWGCDTDHQKWIADQMALITKEHEPVDQFFVVALGDNFYEAGVDSTTDKKWKSVFSEPYEKVTCPWYPILGTNL